MVHHLGPATERADVQPAADHLAEAGQVGPYAEPGLGAAPGDAEDPDALILRADRAMYATKAARRAGEG